MPTECADQARIDAAVAGLELLFAEWPALAPEVRRDRVGELATAQLFELAPKVPELKLELGNLQPLSGQFEASKWQLSLDGAKFSRPRLTLLDEGHIVESLVHELCHALQFLRMGRVLAARGRSAEAIARALSLKHEVAAWTRARPWRTKDAARKEAEGWLADHKATENVLERMQAAARRRMDAEERLARLRARKHPPGPQQLRSLAEPIATATAEEEATRREYQQHVFELYAFRIGLVGFHRYVKRKSP